MKQLVIEGELYHAYQLTTRQVVYSSSGGVTKVTVGLPTDWVVSDRFMNLVVMKDAALKELTDGPAEPSTSNH